MHFCSMYSDAATQLSRAAASFSQTNFAAAGCFALGMGNRPEWNQPGGSVSNVHELTCNCSTAYKQSRLLNHETADTCCVLQQQTGVSVVWQQGCRPEWLLAHHVLSSRSIVVSHRSCCTVHQGAWLVSNASIMLTHCNALASAARMHAAQKLARSAYLRNSMSSIQLALHTSCATHLCDDGRAHATSCASIACGSAVVAAPTRVRLTSAEGSRMLDDLRVSCRRCVFTWAFWVSSA